MRVVRVQRGVALRAVARTLGITEGQAATLILGLAVGLATAMIGIPPTLRERAESGRLPSAALVPAPRVEVAGTQPPPVGAPRDVVFTAAPPDPAESAHAAAPSVRGQEASEATAALPEPFGTISTVAGLPGRPTGVAAAGEAIFVATNFSDGSAAVVSLTRTGRVIRSSPVAVTAGGGGLRELRGWGDSVVVARAAPPAVLWLDPHTGTVTREVEILDLPPCIVAALISPCEPGPLNRAPAPSGLVVAQDGTAFVSDAGQATIWRIRPSERAEPWFQSPQLIAPSGPAGLDIDGNGHLVVAVPSSLLTALGGAVYLLEVGDDGRAGALRRLTTTERGSAPTGVAVASSGRVYVTLAGAGQLLVLEPDGTHGGRLPAGPGDRLAEPYGIAFDAEAVLVTARDAEDPARGTVVRVAVGEPAVAPPPGR